MTDHFPADFPPDPTGTPDPLRWTTRVIALSALALSLLNAAALASWIQDLPAAPGTARAIAAADAWQAGTTQLGLDTPRAALRGAWQRAEGAQWQGGGQAEAKR